MRRAACNSSPEFAGNNLFVSLKILVSNDDGYQAPGLAVLAAELGELGSVTVVAPDGNRSGASNSITLVRNVLLRQHEEHVYSVDGTPADCLQVAFAGSVCEQPDIVVSGIAMSADVRPVFNLNVPDIAYEELKGFRVTRLGSRFAPAPATLQEQHSTSAEINLREDGTDFNAVENGFVSVTPLKTDLTDRERFPGFDQLLSRNFTRGGSDGPADG